VPEILIINHLNDQDRAKRLAEPIRAAGYEVYYSESVFVGESLTQKAHEALQRGARAVVFAAMATIGSRTMKRAIRSALHFGKAEGPSVLTARMMLTLTLTNSRRETLSWQNAMIALKSG
jgi:hypothetical protein